jgi:DNA polymerase-1
MLYDKEEVEKRYGLSPALLDDYRGLKGDPSDNIPGVKGIGEKTAVKLLRRFGGLEELYQAVSSQGGKDEDTEPSIPQRVKRLLEQGRNQAFLSRELAQVKKDVPLDLNLDQCGFDNYDKEEVGDKFSELGFKSLIGRLPSTLRKQRPLFR